MKAELRGIVKAIAGGRPAASREAILSRLGILAQGHVQQEITALRSPPNAPSTIRQKGSSNPLIHTGAMRAAVTFQLGESEGGGLLSSVSRSTLRVGL
ncbi:hypothetical protein VQ042_08035 [Aurantimonas sp. A2-1-M11]|uniref:hypothetical protein n=1 Tax=Aurantimonas sp. A2-1-M11 TaxID=3113712 RepID=UPI002F92C84F